jgi:hypothetical protein
MTIVRGPRQDRYTVLNRTLISDDRLSFRALGLLTFILDKPDHWRIDSIDLAKGEGREGRDAVRTALKELEAAGYLRRQRVHRPDGTFDMLSTVFDSPEAATRAGKPGPGNPALDNQATNTSTGTEDCEDSDAPVLQAATQPSEPARAAVAEATPRQRPRDELFDAMTEACGIIQSEMTRTLHGQASKAVVELRKAGATPDEVARRADVYRSLYPDNTLTPAALCKHWAMVREVRAPAARHGTSNAVSALREHMAAKAAS